MNKLDRVFRSTVSLNLEARRLEAAKAGLLRAKNWRTKVDIVTSLIDCSPATELERQRVRNRMLFELLPRVSNTEYRLIECTYGSRVHQIMFALENADTYETYAASCEFIGEMEDLTVLNDVNRNICAKYCVFEIYERYGRQILANMLAACDQNIFGEFLMTFSEWHFGMVPVDLEAIEAFAFRLTTF